MAERLAPLLRLAGTGCEPCHFVSSFGPSERPLLEKPQQLPQVNCGKGTYIRTGCRKKPFRQLRMYFCVLWGHG